MTESIVPDPDEHLTTGWEPDLPADDTLVRQAVLAHASWPLAVASALGRPVRRTPRWAGGRLGDHGDLTNPVLLLQPLEDPAEVLAEIGALIPAHVPYVLISAWPTPDLTPAGLTLLGHPPLMARFPAPPPASSRPGVEVREVTDAEDLATAEWVLIEGYPMPTMRTGEVFGPGLLGGATRVWLGLVDGEPAAVAVGHVSAGVTLVEYVAALPVARGRGVGAAVTWAATLAAPEQPAVLLASDDGRPVYERMGYVAVERWTAWLRRP